MADDPQNDDQWLYGENSEPAPEEVENTSEELPNDLDQNHNTDAEVNDNCETEAETDKVDAPPSEEPPKEGDDAVDGDTQQDETAGENNENEVDNRNGEASDNDKEEYDEDSDDDVNVVIGDFKTTPAYSSLNIKRGGLLTSTTKGDKPQAQPGKFTVEEFEQAGLINGIPLADFNLDSLEDKPWRKPGADITDYFNYGFNEDTWRAYCERQKRMRVNESGTGLLPLNTIGIQRPSVVSNMNDNSKYAANYLGIRKAGPPPARRMTGAIDVIGGNTAVLSGVSIKVIQPKENVIQVMTADRREYSRKPPAFPDMSVPPPTFEEFVPEMNYHPDPEAFYGNYEPTQDVQWGTESNPTWQPQEIKTLTSTSPGPTLIPSPMAMPSPAPSVMPAVIPPVSPVVERSPPPPRRSRSRERESSRREVERLRDRERSHRRERSRSRSRRHKSRSRSPSRSHRSHRKKKSRRHDDSD